MLMYTHRIPYYVVHKHIIPYTYLPQSKALLRDIRNYIQDINLIEDTYLTQYNEFILLSDLFLFHGFNYTMSDISTNLASLFKRHIVFQNKKHIELYPYLRSMNVSNRRHSTVKFIWGLMSPEERNTFINDYLLDNMTV
jgi:hypothetical protein